MTHVVISARIKPGQEEQKSKDFYYHEEFDPGSG